MENTNQFCHDLLSESDVIFTFIENVANDFFSTFIDQETEQGLDQTNKELLKIMILMKIYEIDTTSLVITQANKKDILKEFIKRINSKLN